MHLTHQYSGDVGFLKGPFDGIFLGIAGLTDEDCALLEFTFPSSFRALNTLWFCFWPGIFIQPCVRLLPR